MDRPTHQTSAGSWRTDLAALVLLCACLVFLSNAVLVRQGNLAWDDADYLRRGLADARASLSVSPVLPVAGLVQRLILERPKPPFLVGWIAAGVLSFGKGSLNALLIHATVLPFGLLLAAVFWLAKRLYGGRAGLLAMTFLLASSRGLSFGAKTMVETFLGLWVVLALGLASLVVERPSRKTGALLGAVLGLALLTKLTTVILLAGALVPVLWWSVQPGADRPRKLRALGYAILMSVLIAGPWYGRNAVATIRFASYSSRFSELAEGRSDVVSTTGRLVGLAADLPGWPLVCGLLLVCSTAWIGIQRSASLPVDSAPLANSIAQRFEVLAAASALVGTGILLVPAYFDSRFLLPLWPSLSVGLGGRFASVLIRLGTLPRLTMYAGLAGCLAASAISFWREPLTTTPWAAAALIDRLVREHGIKTLANVGNLESWNVCKTGLINELREHPEECFVLDDLSAEAPEGLRSRIPRFDAVVVLDPAAFPTGALAAAPRLNRACGTIMEIIRSDPALERVAGLDPNGLPPLAVFVRRRAVQDLVPRTVRDHPNRQKIRR
jgi:hypothetical protein